MLVRIVGVVALLTLVSCGVPAAGSRLARLQSAIEQAEAELAIDDSALLETSAQYDMANGEAFLRAPYLPSTVNGPMYTRSGPQSGAATAWMEKAAVPAWSALPFGPRTPAGAYVLPFDKMREVQDEFSWNHNDAEPAAPPQFAFAAPIFIEQGEQQTNTDAADTETEADADSDAETETEADSEAESESGDDNMVVAIEVENLEEALAAPEMPVAGAAAGAGAAPHVPVVSAGGIDQNGNMELNIDGSRVHVHVTQFAASSPDGQLLADVEKRMDRLHHAAMDKIASLITDIQQKRKAKAPCLRKLSKVVNQFKKDFLRESQEMSRIAGVADPITAARPAFVEMEATTTEAAEEELSDDNMVAAIEVENLAEALADPAPAVPAAPAAAAHVPVVTADGIDKNGDMTLNIDGSRVHVHVTQFAASQPDAVALRAVESRMDALHTKAMTQISSLIKDIQTKRQAKAPCLRQLSKVVRDFKAEFLRESQEMSRIAGVRDPIQEVPKGLGASFLEVQESESESAENDAEVDADADADTETETDDSADAESEQDDDDAALVEESDSAPPQLIPSDFWSSRGPSPSFGSYSNPYGDLMNPTSRGSQQDAQRALLQRAAAAAAMNPFAGGAAAFAVRALPPNHILSPTAEAYAQGALPPFADQMEPFAHLPAGVGAPSSASVGDNTPVEL